MESSPVRFPHCDSLILHSPGACAYCDRYPGRQKLREAGGLAFSDTPPEEVERLGLRPCPSVARRSAEMRDRWPGNQARRAE